MKFSVAAASSFIAATVAATLPEAFTLVAEGGYTVLTDGTNAFIGADATTHPILLLRPASNGMVSYTAQDQTPTGWQNLYVVQDTNEPIALTVPHSGATPAGANLTGFGVNDEGYFTVGGETLFGVLADAGESKEVYWVGGEDGQFQNAPLWVKECKGC
ncbi:uncharacterized protein CDV56_101801 [Aspergillus thermomutatus]|uniref:Uncharacterized protein n=1 Tax=Aspergillus thermomutatus TaxID=41047 RepID=A0A397HK00_ASPTH|nr:uncharacterized protein CDV56_101801 [Aspergillus thermomutatus]RHZ63412.1 hypothetical protein CDV56_101801 [Aspergillus thermomutatus]